MASLPILRDFWRFSFRCFDCKKSNCLTLAITQTDFFNNYLRITCDECNASKSTWLLHQKFNAAFHGGLTMAGITKPQAQRAFCFGGFSVTTTSGQACVPDFVQGGKASSKFQKIVDNIILNLASESMLNFRKSLVAERRIQYPKQVDVSFDGTYNDTGHKKNSAQGCIVSCVAKVRGDYKIIGQEVVKKRQEYSEEQLQKHSRGTIAPKGTCSSTLETIGTREIYEKTLLPIHQELPNHMINICCDGDAKIRDPKNTNVFKDPEKEDEEMIPQEKIIYSKDVAHVLKNLWGTCGRNLEAGSSRSKFTKNQKLEVHQRLRCMFKEIMDKRKSGEWSHEDAMKKVKKTIHHACGDHRYCDENCPRKPGIIQPHGDLSQEDCIRKLQEFMDKNFPESFIKELSNTGTTSPVEYYHAEIIRRRLHVKGTFASPINMRYEKPGLYASQVDRDIENSRKNHSVEAETTDDDFPSYEEFLENEGEQNSIDEEIEE
ncbi:Oidioi.mRNA.OKI2018_I69.chr1.g1846.t1.cds [Oikopleura dioica]|uniref:Oidioi.mRNA.OKI2018_I69.chr1.g1846.t1.cds n=1 Tax=Oikopleura dioica TaxID=34765 RepID=A0ABN7SP74_OIKDI|nr:Oidioi.mRNA.OKI2018_I69.chr1.g1846.t1.cds [Oikopleura dioica]